MNEVLQRGLTLSLPWRVLGFLGLSLLLIALAWLVLLRPQQRVCALQAQQLEQRSQQVQLRQQQLAAQPAIGVLQNDITRLQQTDDVADVPSQPFENLVSARGKLLMSWQPDSQPPLLQLRLGWSQFLPLFSELASTHLAVPQRFELWADQGVINTQLWLEGDDAE